MILKSKMISNKGKRAYLPEIRIYNNNTSIEQTNQRRVLMDGHGKYHSITDIQSPDNNYTPMQP